MDHICFSFFKGMHCHAAIVAGLVCSRFNHSTNKLEPGSLTLENFRNGSIKSRNRALQSQPFEPDYVKKIDAPMFENPFHLSAYVSKQNMNAADSIEATLLH
jgi:hypothetical protein